MKLDKYSLYKTDQLLLSFGATDEAMKSYKDVLVWLDDHPVKKEKDYDINVAKLYEFINAVEDDLFLYLPFDYDEVTYKSFAIGVDCYLEIVALVSFACTLLNTKFSIDLLNPTDFGSVSFSRVLSSEAFESNITVLIFQEEIQLIPMFLRITRILIEALLSQPNMRIEDAAQNNIWAILHILATKRSSKEVISTIEKLSFYSRCITNSDNASSLHGAEVLYYFEEELANVILNNYIAISTLYDLEKGLFDVFSPLLVPYLKDNRHIQDFRIAGAFILKQQQPQFNEEGLIVLTRRGEGNE